MIDETRNVSTMEVTSTTEAQAKRRCESNAGNSGAIPKATQELV